MITRFSGQFDYLDPNYTLAVPIYVLGGEASTLALAYRAASYFDQPGLGHVVLEHGLNYRMPENLGGVNREQSFLWRNCQYHWLVNLNLQKFVRNTDLGYRLVRTMTETLVYGNRGHDNRLGDCMCGNCLSLHGDNLLGKALMEVRLILTESRQEDWIVPAQATYRGWT